MWRSLLGVCAVLGACSSPTMSPDRDFAPSAGAVSRARVKELRALENATRAYFLPRTQAPWVDVSGADPYRLVPVAGGFAGILRGSSALVHLDQDLHELSRIALPETPTALCVASATDAWVASRYGQQLLHTRLNDSKVDVHTLRAAGVADLSCDSQHVYVLPADGSDLLTLDAHGGVQDHRPALRGGLRLQRRGRYLLESSLFERSLRVWSLSASGLPTEELARIHHDGALWAFDAVEQGNDLLIAVTGVEDKSLVRAHGEFENIDSFAWVYRLADGSLSELAALNVSDSGVLVPKAVKLSLGSDGARLAVLASGSGRLLQAKFSPDFRAVPHVQTRAALPGVSEAVFAEDGTVSYASPLFDGWVRLDQAGSHLVRVDPERRPSRDVRLGEALFFTELMAPENTSTGTHSRFTCETCHFEGGVDGRVHYTGRADVSVVTKPLFGLANNRPHFSRAMDPDLSSVSHNEFRVAGAGSGTDPWFSLDTSRFPWLRDLGIDRARLEPLELRAALLDFLYAFSHAPNPRSQGRMHFSELETAGALTFRDHCASCHAPRLASDDSTSTVPFEAWEQLVLSRNAPLVWARGDYEKTGVLPYVHERGTRITSLRRLSLKPRYFTNGSAPDLAAVLAEFRDGAGGAQHHVPNEDARLAPLSSESRRALLSFLELL